MMFGMGFASILGLLAMFLIVWGIITVFNSNGNHRQPYFAIGNQSTGADALEILKARYARGEISSTEYERMKRDIVNS